MVYLVKTLDQTWMRAITCFELWYSRRPTVEPIHNAIPPYSMAEQIRPYSPRKENFHSAAIWVECFVYSRSPLAPQLHIKPGDDGPQLNSTIHSIFESSRRGFVHI